MAAARVFVISWTGQHDRAVSIAEQVARAGSPVSIVYSDADADLAISTGVPLIRRPNELFWEDKFKACLDACGKDPLLIIHADCECGDWPGLVAAHAKAVSELGDIGVWAPALSGTPYQPDFVEIVRIGGGSLVFAAMTDGLVFGLSPEVIGRMRQASYGANRFGWGIDVMFCVAAYAQQRWVVIDTAIHVAHSPSRGYDDAEARQGMQGFLSQLRPMEFVQWILLKDHIRIKNLQANRTPA